MISVYQTLHKWLNTVLLPQFKSAIRVSRVQLWHFKKFAKSLKFTGSLKKITTMVQLPNLMMRQKVIMPPTMMRSGFQIKHGHSEQIHSSPLVLPSHRMMSSFHPLLRSPALNSIILNYSVNVFSVKSLAYRIPRTFNRLLHIVRTAMRMFYSKRWWDKYTYETSLVW